MQQGTSSKRARENEDGENHASLELRKTAIGMLAQHPVWNLKLLNNADTGFSDIYKRFAFASTLSDLLADAERVITWIPRAGEPFLFHMAFSPRVPADDAAAAAAPAAAEVDASDPLHIPTVMQRAPPPPPKRDGHAFVYFLNAVRRPMTGDPATHFKPNVPFAQATFLCYLIEERMKDAPCRHKILVTDIIARDAHVLMGWMPGDRRKLLAECGPHLPVGFVLHDTHAFSHYVQHSNQMSDFVKGIPCGVRGVLELTRNPLLPVVTGGAAARRRVARS